MIPLSAFEMALACTAAEGGLGTDPRSLDSLFCALLGRFTQGFNTCWPGPLVVQMLDLRGKNPVVKLSSEFKVQKPNATLCVPRPRYCKMHVIIQTQDNQMFFLRCYQKNSSPQIKIAPGDIAGFFPLSNCPCFQLHGCWLLKGCSFINFSPLLREFTRHLRPQCLRLRV